MKQTTRTTFLTPDRLPGWVARFAAAHGGLASTEDTDGGVLLTDNAGIAAYLEARFPEPPLMGAHKVGSVSARSRGGNQASAVVERVGAEAGRIFAGHGFEYLATGGDKQLVEQTLGSPGLRKYSSLPRLEPLAVTDPNMAVLTRAAADFCAVRVRICDTSG